MPSHKTKKSNSVEKTDGKDELKPLNEYVDDRVELIRQAFACLKPKTIKNITPEFLKGKSIDKLQEICLDEVLGVSKKRLMSIINAAKCPTDTDSSDDSDAPKVVEDHISLSEISSDDDFLNDDRQSRSRKKTKIKKEKPDKDRKKNKDGAKSKKAKNGQPDGMTEKEMTVLELLELQARARAIRSQLAMEPVTKIELDSDDEDTPTSSSNRPTKVSSNSKSGSSSSKEPNNSTNDNGQRKKNQKTSKEPEKSKSPPKPKPDLIKPKAVVESNQDKPQQSSKRIKLKRPIIVANSEDLTKEKSKSPESTAEVKQEAESDRGSSPDVIAMHPSPETVLLSSDSDTEKPTNHSKSPKKSSKKLSQPSKGDTKLASPKSTNTEPTKKGDDPVRQTVSSPIELSLETEELDYDDHMSDTEQPPPPKEAQKVKKTRQYRRKSKDEPNTSNEPEKVEVKSTEVNRDEQSDISLSSESAAEDWEDSIYDVTGDPENDRSRDAPEDLREKLRRKRLEETTKVVTVRSEVRTVDHSKKAEVSPSRESTSRKSSKEKSPLQKPASPEPERQSSAESSGDEGFVKDKIESHHSDSGDGAENDVEPKSTSPEKVLTTEPEIKNTNVEESPQEVEQKVDDEPKISPTPETAEPVEDNQQAEHVTQETIDVDAHIHHTSSSSSSSSGSGSSSENEETNASTKDQQSKPSTSTKTPEDADEMVIDINVSSDDEKLAKDVEAEENQSWGQRWLRSRKVTEVMASSKLGNKVRGKIKEKKVIEKKAAEEKERLEEEERKRLEEEARQQEEAEKKKNEIPDEQLGSVNHFKQLKLLNKLKEEKQKRVEKEAKQAAKKKK